MRPHIVLDLDNTLLCAETQKTFPFKDINTRRKASRFQFYDMDRYYIVFERPHLQSFLDFLFEHFEVSVWTAASKDYGLFVLKNIVLKNPTRRLQNYLFSYHCELSDEEYKSVKDLRLLTQTFKRCQNPIIIDDLREVYDTQPSQCINIKAFRFFEEHSENDQELLLVEEYLKKRFLND